MASNMEKMSGFYSAINHYAEAQREQIAKDIEAFREKHLKEAEDDAQIEAGRLLKKEVAEARADIVREMSHKEIDARRVLLEKRQNIEDEVFAKAKEKLVEFTKTFGYEKSLNKFATDIKNVMNDSNTTFYVKNGDGKAKAAIMNTFGASATVKVDDKIEIGGFRAENLALRKTLDNTLDAMLDDQHSWFEENSGLAIV